MLTGEFKGFPGIGVQFWISKIDEQSFTLAGLVGNDQRLPGYRLHVYVNDTLYQLRRLAKNLNIIHTGYL